MELKILMSFGSMNVTTKLNVCWGLSSEEGSENFISWKKWHVLCSIIGWVPKTVRETIHWKTLEWRETREKAVSSHYELSGPLRIFLLENVDQETKYYDVLPGIKYYPLQEANATDKCLEHQFTQHILYDENR
jgi:hypothetical protein